MKNKKMLALFVATATISTISIAMETSEETPQASDTQSTLSEQEQTEEAEN
jgi:hypothetical protein